MKKLVSLILVVALMLTMISCGARPEQVESGDAAALTEMADSSEAVDASEDDSSSNPVSGPRKKLHKPVLKFSGWAKQQYVIAQTLSLEAGAL